MIEQIEDRMLYVEHPGYGILWSDDEGIEIYTNDRGGTYVAATWWQYGQGRVFANVPAAEVIVGEVWPCVWGAHPPYTAHCGGDATEFIDGQPYCPQHVSAIKALDALDAW